MVPEAIRRLALEAEQEGGRIYAVGGAVRDRLLGRENEDVDLTGTLSQESVMKICSDLGIPCIAMSTRLGTLRIEHGQQVYEYTPFRVDVYAEGGEHRPVEVRFGVSMEEDASRRDFTVNAIYQDILTDRLEDPLNGQKDLEKRLLRVCAEDTLHSDALRILRLVRFSGRLGFQIEEKTFADAKQYAPLLKDIVPERKWDEFTKILLCDVREPMKPGLCEPMKESGKVLEALHQLDAIGVWPYLIPEIEEGKGLEQRSDYHAYTVLEHLYHSCACTPPELTLRLAGLLHDVGKARCFRENGNYYMHMKYGERMVHEILQRLRCPKKTEEEAAFLTAQHMYDIQNGAKDKTLRKKFMEWGIERTEELILVREADIRGSGKNAEYVAERWREMLSVMLRDGTPFTIGMLHVDGEILQRELGVTDGREIGRILQELRQHCGTRPEDNTEKQLVRLAKRMI